MIDSRYLDSETVKLIEQQASRIVSQAGMQQNSLRTPPPGVSIVISNRDRQYLLARSIRSALSAAQIMQQDQVKAEVLVIDNDSRDGSLTLLRQLEARYCRSGLKILAMQHNMGLPFRRDIALEMSSYRHLVFLDATYELVPHNLPLFCRAAAETHAAMIYGDMICKTQAAEAPGVTLDESSQPTRFAANDIDACALFDRAQVFDAGGFDRHPQVQAQGHRGLLLHLMASGRRIVYVPAAFGICHYWLDAKPDEAQTSVRYGFGEKINHLRYHPDTGYF